ncbi:uncharacterized protein DFL_002400 [Arthrobotrys flagrans]|uniref:Uncharacterized protein n=1 Tax=Arthrobotrys flagrans TaxID=97331 RepID=A0A437AAB5_ARTFL|nr:hypothetical protein DFL_002400 [Arthrobotrys flagrans]
MAALALSSTILAAPAPFQVSNKIAASLGNFRQPSKSTPKTPVPAKATFKKTSSNLLRFATRKYFGTN